MTRKSATKKPRVQMPGIEWVAESLRFTAFMAPEAEPKYDLYKAFTGSDPDEAAERHPGGFRSEKGKFRNSQLSVSRSPGRIDAIFARADRAPEDVATKPFSDIGTFDAAILEFTPVIEKWISSAPPILRVAFGAILFKEFETTKETYDFLQKALPAIHMDDTTTDVLFQINRRRPSRAFEGQLINQLRKWSAFEAQFLVLNPQGGLSTVSKVSAVRLELDFSSAAENTTPLGSSAAGSIFLELVEAAQEIAQSGEA